MARPPGPGKCVHCLKHRSDRTWDHVFPKGWYPDTTPPNLEKWQIPACRKCNAEYGKIEEDLLIRVSMALDPDDPRSSGIIEKAMRALNPNLGKSPKDRRRRQQKREQILRGAMSGDQIPVKSLYPGLDRTWGRSIEELHAIRVKAPYIWRLNEKIVRGIFYIEDEKFIEPPHHVHTYIVNDDGAAPIKEMLDKYGSQYAREPGIVVHRAVAIEDAVSSFFSIEIWGQFKMYAVVDDCNEPERRR